MRDFTKPVVVVSKCIEFEPVRYNGQMMTSDLVRSLKPLVEFTPVCPEVGVGLGVPREPIRIVKGDDGLRLIQPATGLDLTDRMNRFSREFLDALPEVDGFILKSKSPSSAMKDAKIYPSTEQVSPLGKGPGFFGGAVVEEVRRFFPERVFESVIPRTVRLAEAPSYGQPISVYAPSSNGALAYAALAREVLAGDGISIPIMEG